MSDNYLLDDVHVPTTDVSGRRVLDAAAMSKDFYTEVALGNVPGFSLIKKFGAGTIGTTLAPVTISGNYQTPTTAQSLEFLSDDVNDTSAGTGAREVEVIGLDENWAEVAQTVVTNGTTPVALTTDLTRLYRWRVSSSGTYATQSVGSHAGNLTIRGTGGGAIWSTITNSPFATGQSQIGAYTIPIGYTGFLLSKIVFTDTSKSADVYLFQRDNANDVTIPYTGIMRLLEREVGVQGGFVHLVRAPASPLTGPCDIGLLAKVSSGTADVSVEFELLLVAD